MKVLNKIVAMVSTVAMVASVAAFSVSAAGAKTLTVDVTDADGKALTAELAAGSEIIVTVTLSSNEDIGAVGYQLVCPMDKITADATLQGTGAAANKFAKWLDATWYNECKSYSNTIGGYYGKPTYNLTEKGPKLTFYGDYIDAADVASDVVVGKFHFTVKNAVNKDNQLKFSFEDATTLEKGLGDTACTFSEASFGAGGGSTTDAVVTPVAPDTETKTSSLAGHFTKGFGGSIAPKAQTVTGLSITFDNGNGTPVVKTWDFGTSFSGESAISFGINVYHIPDGVTLTTTCAPIVAE